MTTAILAVRGEAWERLARLREVIELIAEVRELHDPFGSVEQFRRLVSFVIRFASLFDVDRAWLDRWESILTDDELVEAVLAVTRYVLSLSSVASSKDRIVAFKSSNVVLVDRRSYVDWLPLVVELLQLVLRLRGKQ